MFAISHGVEFRTFLSQSSLAEISLAHLVTAAMCPVVLLTSVATYTSPFTN